VGGSSGWAKGWSSPAAKDEASYLEARERFREWVMADAQRAYRAHVRRALKGLNLGCYCPEGWPCHGDILLEIANGPEEGPAGRWRGKRRSPAG
jgi:hypothetical protein